MFWGLEMEPAKVYKQSVQKSFHISMACLQPNKCTDSNYSTLTLRKDNKDFVLCNLHKDKAIQVQLDLMFGSGDEIAFTVTGGKNQVYLSGYILEEDEDDMFEGSEGEEMEEEIPKLVEIKRKIDSSSFGSKNKKAKLKQESSDEDEEDEEDADDDDDDDEEEEGGGGDSANIQLEAEEDSDESGNDSDDESDEEDSDTAPNFSTTPKGKQQMNKSLNEKQQKTPTTPGSVNGKFPKGKKDRRDTPVVAGHTPKTPKTPGNEMEPVREGGVMVKDLKLGAGPVAKPGKKIAVYYTGRLKQNNKQFDSSTQGKGFVFKLGGGEVIKGWDVGIAGMKVGGKRLLTIPAPMAYGNKGSPPVIPSNATLVFEVELRNVL